VALHQPDGHGQHREAASGATLLVVGYLVLSRNFAGYSRSVFVLDWFFTMALVAGLRVGIRLFYGLGFVDLPSVLRRSRKHTTATRCVIIGAATPPNACCATSPAPRKTTCTWWPCSTTTPRSRARPCTACPWSARCAP
jgi:FlaA1/EpsC-like NDP-sugar epimerase